MYKIAFGPLYKSVGRTLGLVGIRYFFEELVEPLNNKYPLPLVFSQASFHPRQFVDCFMSVCECFVCFGAAKGRTLKVSLQGGTARLPSFFKYVVILPDFCLVLLVVVVSLVML